MEGREFVFDYVQLLYCECHKISPNPGGTYINSSDWIKNKIAAENPINKKDRKCFQYAVTATLDYEERKKDPQGTTKIKPFINKYNWEGTNIPLEKDDWKIFEKNKVTIALNILYAKEEKIYSAYVSKQNSNLEKQVIHLMISDWEKCKAKSEGRDNVIILR